LENVLRPCGIAYRTGDDTVILTGLLIVQAREVVAELKHLALAAHCRTAIDEVRKGRSRIASLEAIFTGDVLMCSLYRNGATIIEEREGGATSGAVKTLRRSDAGNRLAIFATLVQSSELRQAHADVIFSEAFVPRQVPHWSIPNGLEGTTDSYTSREK
jgi:hypothetical protein